jgi:hypothetical protein
MQGACEREEEDPMGTSGLAQRTGGLDIVTHRLGDAQAKWDRLTASDYKRVRTVRDLIAAVKDRYSLPHEQARRDVETWLKEVGLTPRRI